MAAISSYTEDELKQYMESVLGDTATKLDWSFQDGDFDEPVAEVLLRLNEDDFSFVNTKSEAAKVRSIARVEVWRAAMYYTAHEAQHSVGAPGTGQTSRADIHRASKSMYDLAYSEMIRDYPELGQQNYRAAEVYTVRYSNDHYKPDD